MILTTFGKEFIIINEEIAIYISFLIVLTILVTNFGKQMSAQFAEQANIIAESYSVGTQLKVKNNLKTITANYKTVNFIVYLTRFETTAIYKLLKLKNTIVRAIIAAEYKLA